MVMSNSMLLWVLCPRVGPRHSRSCMNYLHHASHNANKALTCMCKCKVSDKETTRQQQILHWRYSCHGVQTINSKHSLQFYSPRLRRFQVLRSGERLSEDAFGSKWVQVAD